MKVRKVVGSTGIEGGISTHIRTDEQYRQADAKWKGRVVGAYGEPKHLNPYNPNDALYTVWLVGWEAGHEAHLRMKTRKVRAI